MPTPHYNYYPPAGAAIDQSDPRVTWNGRAWMLSGKVYGVPSSHRLIGRPGSQLDGWYYDWGRRAWIEPDGGGSQMTGPTRPRPAPRPAPQPQPQPQPPAPQPEKKECSMEKKEATVMEYLVKHPVAPLLGGFMLLGAQLAEEPVPPQIPDDLPEVVAKQWQMVYAQNLQRFQRRMGIWENVGKLLLGYADTNAVLAALPAKRAA